MKILGIILIIGGLLGDWFIIEALPGSFSSSIWGMLGMILWTICTLGVGKALIQYNSDDQKKD